MRLLNDALAAKLLEAAKTEFLTKGFRNASLRNIAASAGVTTGAIYRYYANKEALFDARDTLVKSLVVFNAMLAACTFNTENMARGAAGGFTNATDAADYLVKKGMPFRDAHAVIGHLVLEISYPAF